MEKSTADAACESLQRLNALGSGPVSGQFSNICMNCFGDKGLTPECPMCRYSEISDIDPRVLRPRTRIGSHYVVGKLLFQPGGFGMTYKGWDLTSGNIVAIKEYFPRSVADRAADGINVRATDEELFEYGLVRFEDEAQQLLMLRNVDHVVNVHGYFEENSTAYIVMEYYDGCNLSEYIKINNGSLSEPQVKSILFDLAGALGKVHALGYLHRDIKPSNIYITKDIVPILLDFGSARFAISEKTQSLSVLYTEGFAPFEQYQTHGKQGPWTDIYGLAATLYFALTGVSPPFAPDRWENDQLRPLHALVPNISEALEKAIHHGLAVRAEQRPQSIEEFLEALDSTSRRNDTDVDKPSVPVTPIRPIPFPTPPKPSVPHPTAPKVRLSLAGEIFLTILAAIIAFIVLRSFFSLPVTVLSILSYATLCYAVYLAWGDRKGISFWALCIPAYNIRRFMRGQGTHGDSVGGPNNDEEIHVVFDSGPWQGSELQLRNQQTIFGRDPSAHLRLENLQVSRRHVALSLDGSPAAAIVVADLGSSNGTWFAQASDDGTWSAWQKVSDDLRIPLNARHRYRVRLGGDGDQFHFE